MASFDAFNRLSLIEDRILAFYKEPGKSNASLDGADVEKFFQSSICFDFHRIRRFLWPKVEDNAVDTIFNDMNGYPHEECLRCYCELNPIFRFVEKKLTHGDWADLNLCLEWLGEGRFEHLSPKVSGSEDTIRKSSQILLNVQDSACHGLENALLLTAMADKALANVYCTISGEKLAPHLLKDLIGSQQLKHIFGPDAVIFLKLLLGLPNSMNLRNIIWHGFPRSSTVPNYYATTLLLILHSLGVLLNKQLESASFQLQQKPLIKDFNEYLQPMFQKNNCKFSHGDNVEFQKTLLQLEQTLLEEVKRTTYFRDGNYVTIWLELFQLYKQHQYLRFVILAVPQIELLLRCHYGQANGVEIMAKLNDYYVIIDTIFSDEVPENLLLNGAKASVNKLLNFNRNDGTVTVPEGCFKILYDLFLDSDGCRLRDRVSHGEVDLLALNNSNLSSLLMHVLVVLLRFSGTEDICLDSVQCYESVYHLNCRSRNQLLRVHGEFQGFNEFRAHIRLPEDIDLDERLRRDVKIFMRPKKEYELMTLMEKIGISLQQTIRNYRIMLRERLRMLELHELHSRNRKSLSNLLKALPTIWENIIEIWQSMAATFLLLQDDAVFWLNTGGVGKEEGAVDEILRFLKQTLSICQNISKYSRPDSNIWIRVLEFMEKFRIIKKSILHPNRGE